MPQFDSIPHAVSLDTIDQDTTLKLRDPDLRYLGRKGFTQSQTGQRIHSVYASQHCWGSVHPPNSCQNQQRKCLLIPAAAELRMEVKCNDLALPGRSCVVPATSSTEAACDTAL